MDRKLTRRAQAAAATIATTLATIAFAPAVAAEAQPSLPTYELRLERGADGEIVRTSNGMADRLGLSSEDDLRDPATWRALARRNLEAAGLTTVSARDERADVGAAEQDCDAGCPTPVAVSTSYASGIGDLDGDGAEDVLLVSSTVDVETWQEFGTIEARSAVSGDLLWSDALHGYAYFVSVPDIDGDGRVDILQVAFEGTYQEDGCGDSDADDCNSFAFTDHVTVTARVGVTGTALATNSFDSSYSFRSTQSYGERDLGYTDGYSYEVSISNGFAALALLDLAGDGTSSLVRESFDVTYAVREEHTHDDLLLTEVFTYEYAEAEELAGRIVEVDLRTGAATTILDRADAIAYVLVLADEDADRLVVDVVPELGTREGGCTEVFESCLVGPDAPVTGGGDQPPGPSATRAMYGADMTVVWEVELDPTLRSFFAYGVDDIDGDGHVDLIDVGVDEDHEDVLLAQSGATGAELWRSDLAFGAPADGGFLGARVAFDFDGETESIVITGVLLDRVTGAVVTEREVARIDFTDAEESEDVVTSISVGLLLLPLVGDDLDMLVERSIQTYRMHESCDTEVEDGEEYEYCEYDLELLESSTEVEGVDGEDLGTLFTRSIDGYLMAVLDLDVDGQVELVTDTGAGPTATTLNGDLLWSLPNHWIDAFVRGADGALDMVTHDVTDGAIELRDGRDAALRWRVG